MKEAWGFCCGSSQYRAVLFLEGTWEGWKTGWGRLMYYVWMLDKDTGKRTFTIMGMVLGEAEMRNPVSYFLAL